MLEVHTQENGISILIAEMEDGHLINTIQMICTKIQLLGEVISCKEIEFDNAIMQALMPDLDTANVKKMAKYKLQSLDETIKPYICFSSSNHNAFAKLSNARNGSPTSTGKEEL